MNLGCCVRWPAVNLDLNLVGMGVPAAVSTRVDMKSFERCFAVCMLQKRSATYFVSKAV